jgi:hypothetical protein
MELASHYGGDVWAEIRKQLASIAKSRPYIVGREQCDLKISRVAA